MRISDWSSDVCSSDLVPQDWIDNVLYAGAAQALQAAIEHRARADATIATGLTNDFNNYRRPHIDVNADADAHMAMLTFNHAGTRKPIARILQYVAHPTAIDRSEEHTSELQSLMRISYAVFGLKKNKN